MKTRKFIFSFFILLLFSQINFFAQDLSNSVYSFLKKNKLTPVTQTLVTSGDNPFSYNVVLNFPSKIPTEDNLILVFNQEDVENNQQLFLDFFNYIEEQDFEVNFTVLFSYGEKQNIQKDGMVYGTDVFIKQLNTNLDYTALIVDLNHSENVIITNSDGNTGPSYLINNVLNAYSHNKFKEKLSFFYLSQIYTFDFYSDRILSSFFNNNIPSIKLCFQDDEQRKDSVLNVLKQVVNSYSQKITKTWDHHFLMINFFGNYITLSESMTVKIIVVIFLYLSVYLFMLIFINNRLKKFGWMHLKNIWFILPLTVLVTWLSFLAGKIMFINISPTFSIAGKIYCFFAIPLCLSLIFNSLLYSIVLFLNPYFEERSIDYLITLSCVFNQSIFVLYDISLFPIFLYICLLSILALIVKNNGLHILIFLLMIFALIPYATNIITTADLISLLNFLYNSKTISLVMALVFCPVLLVYLRILVSVRSKAKTILKNILYVSGSIILFCSAIIIISIVRSGVINKGIKTENISFITDDKNKIYCSYADTKIFNDTIRNLSITMSSSPVQCDVKIISEEQSPILYTDNEYEQLTPNSVYFLIPYYPPKQMSFSYGAQNGPSTVLVTAYFETGEKNVYSKVSTKLSIGEQ